jgi:hypothetical protein
MVQLVNSRSVDVVLQKGPRSKTEITIGSTAAREAAVGRGDHNAGE